MAPTRNPDPSDLTESAAEPLTNPLAISTTHLTASNDDDVATDTERRDDVPVLACENGVCAVQPLPAKKSRYLNKLWLGRRGPCTGRVREGVILSMGVLLTCIALGLIVAGALRSDEHGTRSAFLHVSSLLKRLPEQKVKMSRKPITDDTFSFDQLLTLNNYALNKPSQQSSVFLEVLDIPELDGEADFAVDGSVTTCARTDPEENPYWYVDLGQIEHVRSVRLYGSDANPLHDLEVHVGNSENVTANELCTRQTGKSSSLDVRIVCDTEQSGRYIGIILRTKPGRAESLIICEALVYLI